MTQHAGSPKKFAAGEEISDENNQDIRQDVWACALLSATAFAGAEAHVSFLDKQATQDSTILATLQVPHGCDGKSTTEVRVKLPEGFVFAKPQPKPGWELEVIRGDYQKSYDNHGDKVKTGASRSAGRTAISPTISTTLSSFRGRFPASRPALRSPFR